MHKYLLLYSKVPLSRGSHTTSPAFYSASDIPPTEDQQVDPQEQLLELAAKLAGGQGAENSNTPTTQPTPLSTTETTQKGAKHDGKKPRKPPKPPVKFTKDEKLYSFTYIKDNPCLYKKG